MEKTMKVLKEMKERTRFIAIEKGDETKKVRCMKESDNNIFVFGKNCKNRGYRYSIDSFVLYYQPIIEKEEDKEKKWHKKCKSIEKRLEKSGLWPEIKELFHNLQKMSFTDKKDIYTRYMGAWGEDRNIIMEKIFEDYKEKYPFVFRKAEDGIVYINTDYIWEISEAKTKSMYFGKGRNAMYKEEIAQALNDKQNIKKEARVNYDVSFNYDAEKQKAWYSEEYRNCGNGHYYIALDESCALFIEND